ncbi:glycosyltransferase [Pedobacter changchengzhani]|uniref:Glycosyltransferase n=1 Tax=Pedobacter changchengzhani TaxID=2529274 RepID=A0A4R5MLW8_9SPHI|nr:glycosyltransferase [Pedobacter changchengzhani]TDG36496.1 glycosyltransferase [Pedobacter changchengzhani]
MEANFIDVIIAVYNGEKYIKKAIETVQKQSWQNLNIIIADDGSIDDTVLFVKTLQETDNRIVLLQCSHKGVSATLNAAIKYCNAPYIAMLDVDDLWHEDKLNKQMQAIENGVDICFCLLQEFEDFEDEVARTHSKRNEPLKGYSKSAFLGRRKVFDTFGLFKEDVVIGDFVEWYSRVIRAEQPIVMLNEVLAFRRVHDSNMTRFVDKNAFLSLIKKHLNEKRKDE